MPDPLYIQSDIASADAAGSSIQATFGINPGAQHLIVVGASWADSSNNITLSVADTLGTSYNRIAATHVYVNGAYIQATEMWWGVTSTTGTCTVTVTLSAANPGSFRRLVIAEYSNVRTDTPFDAGNAFTTTGTAMDSGNITTVQDRSLIVGLGLLRSATANMSPGTNLAFTEHEEFATDPPIALEDAIQAAAGTISAQMTASASVQYGLCVAAFRASVENVVPVTLPQRSRFSIAPTQRVD